MNEPIFSRLVQLTHQKKTTDMGNAPKKQLPLCPRLKDRRGEAGYQYTTLSGTREVNIIAEASIVVVMLRVQSASHRGGMLGFLSRPPVMTGDDLGDA